MDDKQRLINLRNAHKISEEDFKVLSTALNNKSAGLSSVISFLINPFQKITGMSALLPGVIILLLSSYVCWYTNFYVIDIFDIAQRKSVPHPNVPYTFWLLIYQNAISWLTLSILYIVVAKLFQKKHLRITDFIGMVGLARLPFLFLMLLLLGIDFFQANYIPSFFYQTWLTALFQLFIYLLLFWQLALYFYALKEASGLTKNKLIFATIISLLIAFPLLRILTMIFVY
ncbi:MAG: hypothetical protein EXR81_03140 [Gammaproteobacteria bacterium]|nr:hypothetical protein [Gammaproteobacteria bacterium]